MKKLYSLLSLLMAASIIHQTNHWNSKGKNFYGDHQLFQRLYEENQPGIDSLGEKILGVELENQIDAEKLTSFVFDAVKNSKQNSIDIENKILALVDDMLSTKENDSLTPGVSNLLEGLHDTHESFLYLLKQRDIKSDAMKIDDIVKLAAQFEEDSVDWHNQKNLIGASQACLGALRGINIQNEAYNFIYQATGILSNLSKSYSADKARSDLPNLITLLQLALEKTTSGEPRSLLMRANRLLDSVAV